MPVVFVHGVATRVERSNGRYNRLVTRRDALFRRLALVGVVADPSRPIISPYWGDWGADPAWSLLSVPGSGIETFGEAVSAEESVMGALLADSWFAGSDDDPVVATAKSGGLPDAVDLLAAAEFDGADAGARAGGAEAEHEEDEKADLLAAMFDFAQRHPRPAWLADAQSGSDLLYKLIEEVNAESDKGNLESFGGAEWERFTESVDRISSLGSRLMGRGALAVARSGIQRKVTEFLGDVFVYLRDGARGQEIRRIIAAALEQASLNRSNSDPLIVVAHSMGGNICYDLFSSSLASLEVDAFVTVGSQVGFFEELKLYSASDDEVRLGAKVDKVRPPASIRSWINVLDTTDPLAFAVEPVFAPPATDFVYNTGAGAFASHSAYWLRPSFHTRLGERLRELLM